MSYINYTLQPSIALLTSISPIVFKDVKCTSERKSIRVRQCYKCGGKINKNHQYVNHQFRYDGRIITISFHKDCFNEK